MGRVDVDDQAPAKPSRIHLPIFFLSESDASVSADINIAINLLGW